MVKKQGLAALLCALLILGMAVGSIFYLGETKEVIVQYKDKPKIIIDSGHGGFDGGAVGVNNTIEKDINLSIALKLRDILQCNGFEVIMTRDSDISLHDPEVTGMAKQKRSDMYNRRDIMEANPDGLFVSIHQNKFGESSSWGAQIFYSPNHEDSEYLAQIVQQKFVKYLQPENRREIKQSGQELFLLHNAKIPAILAECGFISNPEECAKLNSEEYQDQVAFVLFTSLMDYYQQMI